jgi:hypothetical protein
MLNAGYTMALTPQEWCRAVLQALNYRAAESHDARHVQIMLSYFIERDPSSEAFEELLARFIMDWRADIAQAARLLDTCWAAGKMPAGTASLPYREALRTLGGLVDEASAQAAYLQVGVDGAELRAPRAMEPLRLGAPALRQQVAARLALRGQVPWTDSTALASHEARLRALGVLLDQAPAPDGAYRIMATPRTVIVLEPDGTCQEFGEEPLASALRQALAAQHATPTR